MQPAVGSKESGGGGREVPDHDIVTSHGFTPLTRRWTFADDKLNKSNSCGDMQQELLKKDVFLPSQASTLTSTLTAEADFKRELHKASLAQEICQSVARLMVNAWSQGNEMKLMGRAGYEKIVGEAAEAARLHFSKFPFRYAVSVDARDVLIHMKLLEEATRTGRIAVHAELQGLPSGLTGRDPRWVLTISSRDQPHLLDTITRTLTKHVTRIVDADVLTSLDGSQTLDRFVVESSERLNGPGLGRAMDFLLKAGNKHHRPILIGTPTAGRDDSSQGSRGSLSRPPSFAGDENLPDLALDVDDPLHLSARRMSSPNLSRCCFSPFVSETWAEGDDNAREAAAALLLGVSPSAAGFHKLRTDTDQQPAEGHPQGLPTLPFEEITLGACVARGRTADVYEAVLGGKTKGEGRVVAAKVVSLIQTGGGKMAPVDEQAGLLEIQRELGVVRRLSHPNICAFLGVSAGPSCFYLLYEFLEGGSLADLIRDRTRRYDFFKMATEIAAGLGYLHAQGIIHRDVKSKNILLDREGRIKIVDFGLCCLRDRGEDLTGETGTYRWMAPEVIRHEPYSTAADVYSFGIVLWELLTRDQPFRGMTPIQAAFAVARQGRRPIIPPQVPPQLVALIKQCWHEDPAVRPTFEQVLVSLATIRTQLGA